MKLLIAAPGASWSVADVWRGFLGAFQRAGHQVSQYALDGRLAASGGYLTHAWRRARKQHPELAKPTGADILYHASIGLLERGLRLQPDWLLLVAGTYLHPEALLLARRAGLRLAALLTESPYADDQERQLAGLCDVVFTNERASVKTFSDLAPTYYWRHAFDPAQHRPDPAGDPACLAHDVVFVGTGFQERCDLLAEVDWAGLGLDLGLYGTWGLLGSRSRLRQYVRAGIIDNKLTAALYRRATLGLSLHRTSVGYGRAAPRIPHAESMNPRDYELAACGAFFLADARAELTETLGDLIPVFDSPRALADLVVYWTQPAQTAERRARAAQLPAAVAEYTFDTRAAEIARILEQHA